MGLLTSKRFWVLMVMGALFLMGVLSFALNLALQHKPFQRYILNQLAEVGGYDLHVDDIHLTFQGGWGLVAQKLRAHSRRAEHGLFADSVNIKFDASNLLRGRLVTSKVDMESPHIFLTPPPRDAYPKPGAAIKPRVDNVVDFIEQFFLGLETAHLRNARLTISGLDYSLERADITVSQPSLTTSRRQVELTGQIESPTSTAPISIQGHFDPATKTHAIPAAILDVRIGATALAHINWTHHFSFQKGSAETRFNLTVYSDGHADVVGELDLNEPRFQVRKNRRTTPYAFNAAHLSFKGTLLQRAFELSQVKLTIPAMPSADLQCAFGMRWPKTGSPYLKLIVDSAPMALEEFKSLFPTSVVPQWIETKLFPILSGGQARLGQFRLEGFVDHIARLGRVENAHTLGLDIELSNARAFDDGIGPVVENVGGRVVIEKGALTVSEISGTARASVIAKGTVTCPSFYAKPAQLIVAVDGRFDLAEIVEYHRQPIVPEIIRYQLGKVETARGKAVGTVELDFLTNDPRPVLSGEVSIQEAHIVHTDLPVPLAITAAKVSMPKETSSQVTAKGQVGGSDLTLEGQVDLSGRLLGLLRKGPDDFKLEARVDLVDIVSLRHKNWWRSPIGPWLKGLENADGQVETRLHVTQPAAESGLRINSGLFDVKALRLNHPQLRLPLRLETGRYQIADDGSALFSATGAWGDSRFELAGNADQNWQQWRLTGGAKAATSQVLETLWGRNAPRIVTTTPLATRFELSGGEHAVRCQGSVDLAGQRLGWGDVVMQPVAQTPPVEFALTWRAPNQLTIERVRFAPSAVSSLQLRGHYAAQTPQGVPAAGFTLTAKNVDLAPLGMIDRQHQNALSGTLEGELKGTFGRGLASLRLDGRLSADQMVFPFADLPAAISTWGGNLYFKDQQVLLDPLKIEFGNQETATIRGGLGSWNQINGSFEVEADQIDLSWWRQQLKPAQATDASTGRSAKPQRRPLDVALAVRVNSARWQERDLGSLTLGARLNADTVLIDSARLDGPGTRLKFAGRYARTPALSPRFDFKGALNIFEKPLAGLLGGLGMTDNPPTGTASVSGDFALSGDTPADLLANCSANLYGIFNEGHIYHANALLDVLDFISLQNIFIGQPSPILRERFFYQQISANVTIDKGLLRTEDFLMKSPVFNAGAKGGIDLTTKTLDITFAARPLNTIDFLVSKIPIVGHILTGEDKAVLVYSFKITGTLSDPDVKHIPFNNLDDALIGYFKRIFFTPGRILEKISDQTDWTPPTVTDPSATPGGDP